MLLWEIITFDSENDNTLEEHNMCAKRRGFHS